MKPTIRIRQIFSGYGRPFYYAYSTHPHVHYETGAYNNVGKAYDMYMLHCGVV